VSLLRPYIVGLTGGIGSGKSTACALFAELGVEIVDADHVSRSVVAPGSPALQQLREQFGDAVVTRDGSLDRAWLRSRIFSDAAVRQQVEALLHPLIRSAMLEQIQRSRSAWLILAAPLLLENRAYDFVDRVLVIDADEAIQVARTSKRDHASEDEVRRIMQVQLPRSERLARADDVISNNGDTASLRRQVQEYSTLYQKLADERQHAINAL
jgi:dephospho-CoA kinase